MCFEAEWPGAFRPRALFRAELGGKSLLHTGDLGAYPSPSSPGGSGPRALNPLPSAFPPGRAPMSGAVGALSLLHPEPLLVPKPPVKTG